MDKKNFYNRIHKELAEKYKTTPEIIKFIRNYGISQYKLIPLQDKVEAKITILDKTMDENVLAIRKIQTYKRPRNTSFDKEVKITTIGNHIKLCQLKKEFLLKVYTFLRTLGDQKFADITKGRSVPKI